MGRPSSSELANWCRAVSDNQAGNPLEPDDVYTLVVCKPFGVSVGRKTRTKPWLLPGKLCREGPGITVEKTVSHQQINL